MTSVERGNESKHMWDYVCDRGGIADPWDWDCSAREKENRLT